MFAAKKSKLASEKMSIQTPTHITSQQDTMMASEICPPTDAILCLNPRSCFSRTHTGLMFYHYATGQIFMDLQSVVLEVLALKPYTITSSLLCHYVILVQVLDHLRTPTIKGGLALLQWSVPLHSLIHQVITQGKCTYRPIFKKKGIHHSMLILIIPNSICSNL